MNTEQPYRMSGKRACNLARVWSKFAHTHDSSSRLSQIEIYKLKINVHTNRVLMN